MSYRPKLIIQIDCDSEYVMEKHYGVYKKQRYEYYSSLKLFTEKFKNANLKSTLFVVGKDIENKNVQQYIFQAIADGYEIANHSYWHQNRFSSLSIDKFQYEVQKTNNAVYSKFGLQCKGFRAPNFDMKSVYMKILKEEGMQYDCSLLPTPYRPLIKILKGLDTVSAGYMGGSACSVLTGTYASNEKKIKKIRKCKNDIIEIPITTFPYLKFPCHFSYLLAMNSKLAEQIMILLVKWHIKKREPLVFLFHLADLVDNKYLYGTELKYYKSLKERLFLFDKFIELVRYSFDSLTTIEYCNYLNGGGV